MKSVQEKPEIAVAKRLAGKVALVTGGFRGIGAAVSLRLAQGGATGAITYTKNKQAAENVVNDITNLGASAVALKADASSPSEARQLVKELEKTVGKIDVLV